MTLHGTRAVRSNMGTAIKAVVSLLSIMILLAPFAGTATAAEGAGAVTCTGTMTGDVDGGLYVPDGVSCEIFGTINGNIYVAEQGSLTIWFSSVVNGNVMSRSNAASSPWLGRAVDIGGTVNGNVTADGDGIVGVYAGMVTGNVHMRGDGYLQISGFGSSSEVQGNVMNEGTGTTFVGSGFNGTVTVAGHVMDKGGGGGSFMDHWVDTFGVTTIGKSVCGLENDLIYASSSVAGNISEDCSPRKK